MPPIRRSNLAPRSRNAQRIANIRVNQTPEEHAETNERIRGNMAQLRAARSTARGTVALHRAAFQYAPTIAYKDLPCLDIGPLNVVCSHCQALKFASETPGLCCMGGKVKLTPLTPPPEPLKTLLSGETPESNNFLKNIQKYNGCFQMTSFGAQVIDEHGFNPTFKVMSSSKKWHLLHFGTLNSSHLHLPSNIQIQGQIHHRAGSLLPQPNQDHKFLQIYFIGNSSDELDQSCAIFNAMKREIIHQLQEFLHEHNALVQLFKTALESMPSDNYNIIIRADKRPTGEHARQFNAPTIDEVAVVIVGENVESRDIVIRRRNDGAFQRVCETHRSYDALQYPLMMWQGEDGYHFQIKLINPATG